MKDTFCVMPWLGKEIYQNGVVGHCCWLSPKYNIDTVRQELASGIQSSACAKCWAAESNGETSRRQQKNILADTLYDLSIENIQQQCTEYTPTIYQITTSNVCNAACIMCSGAWSSRWETLLGKAKKRTITDDMLDQIDFDTARYVELLGGETLLESKNIEILSRLNSDCVVSIITNGSIELSDQLYTVLKKFKQLIICVSIDGTGRVFEYQRWPLKWDTLLENLEKYRQLQCWLSVNFTLTNVLLPYKQQTIDWFNSENLPYSITVVETPSYFSPSNPVTEETIRELDRQDRMKGIDRRDYGILI